LENSFLEAPNESNFPFLGKFRERISEPPKVVSAKLAASMTELVSAVDGIRQISRSTHGTINSTIFKIAKIYSPDLAKVVLTGEEAYLYPIAKLFPSHLTEWLMATLEFIYQHELELCWVGDEIKARIFRILYQKYGNEYIEMLDKIMRQIRPTKHLDWNRNIYEMVDVVTDIMTSNGTVKELPVFPKRAEEYMLDVLFGANRGLWSVKDVTPVRRQFTIEPHLAPETRKGLITIALITMMNAKQRKEPSQEQNAPQT
jgi:hypothetical protein